MESPPPCSAPLLSGKLPEVGFSVGSLTLIFRESRWPAPCLQARGLWALQLVSCPVERGWPGRCQGCPSKVTGGEEGGSKTRAPSLLAQAGPRPRDSVGAAGRKQPSQVAVPGHDKATLSGPRGPALGRGRPGRFPGLGKLRQPLAILSVSALPLPHTPRASPGAARRVSRKQRAAWGDQAGAYTTPPMDRGEPRGPALHFPGEEERKEKRGSGGLPGGGGAEVGTISKGGDFQEEEDGRAQRSGTAHGLTVAGVAGGEGVDPSPQASGSHRTGACMGEGQGRRGTGALGGRAQVRPRCCGDRTSLL